MAKTKYGVIKIKQPEFSPIELLVVPHREDMDLTVACFGLNTYATNLKKMEEFYFHPQTGEKISFREPTTSESISASAYNFDGIAKPQIFDSKWLQAGRMVITSEGVYVNPPKDEQGNPITDVITLKSFLDKSKKVNGIYLCENDFGFASYETFKKGVQESGDFAESGLARILEHTKEKTAEKLKKISSKKNYPIGVNVCRFDSVNKPILGVAGLFSGRGLDVRLLGFDGNDWLGDYLGYAFGVLN